MLNRKNVAFDNMPPRMNNMAVRLINMSLGLVRMAMRLNNMPLKQDNGTQRLYKMVVKPVECCIG